MTSETSENALPATITVTMENFEDVVEKNPIVVLDFWAGWCKPCQVFAPIFEKVARENPDIVFGKVDTEAAQDLAQAFRVMSIPTIMAFRDSELVFEQAGVLPPEMMFELLRRLRAHPGQAGV